MPSSMDLSTGCPFCTRCHHRIGAICDHEPPPEQLVQDRHVIKCHISIEELGKIEPVIRIPEESERIHVE